MSAPRYVEVGGIEWCVTHGGLLDNGSSDRMVERCDMYDPRVGACNSVQLFYKEVAE